MLKDGGHTTSFGGAAKRVGFLPHGGSCTHGAVHAHAPSDASGAPMSVCGAKAILIEERRAFPRGDGSHVEVDCARVAALAIVDSPVHVHGETVETYWIRQGTGWMVLDGERVAVKPEDVIVIPPGVAHGLFSADPAFPVSVLIQFTPGLASIHDPDFRDERILAPHASQWVGTSG